jgi:hypothetical protein
MAQPLFPPRPDPEPPPPPPPPPSSTAPETINVNSEMASKIERVVMDVFSRRFGGQPLPYGQARVLVSLEMEVVGELVRQIARS